MWTPPANSSNIQTVEIFHRRTKILRIVGQTFLPLSPPYNNINFIEHFNHRSLSPLDGLKVQQKEGRGKSLAFFVYRAAQIIFLRQFRYSRNAIRSISVANAFANASKKKKYIFFPFPDVESWITKRYISIFLKRGTVSSREYGTLCDTSVLRNVARWVSMSCHANDTCILQRRCHIRDDARMIPRILSWVVTIFFNFKKLLRWLIIKEVFLFWLINIFARMNIYIYIYCILLKWNEAKNNTLFKQQVKLNYENN